MRVEERGVAGVNHVGISPNRQLLVISMSNQEAQELKVDWHDEVQVVAGSGVTALLKEAARRLQECDHGHEWSMAFQLQDMVKDLEAFYGASVS